MSLARQSKRLQRLAVHLQSDLVAVWNPALFGGVFKIVLVGVLEVALVLGDMMFPVTLVLNIAFNLVLIRCPASVLIGVLATPAAQRADARSGFAIDQIVGVVFLARLGFFVNKLRQVQTSTEIN